MPSITPTDRDRVAVVELTHREAAELLYMITAGVLMRTRELNAVRANKASTPLQRGAARTQLLAVESARDKLLAAVQRLQATTKESPDGR